MKIAALLAAASVLLASSAFAQSQAPSTNVPPPPGINDPGVRTAASTGRPDDAQDVPARDRKHMTLPPPQVSVREQGDATVQEYRRSGLLYMIVVTPKSGIQQTYMVDPDGTRHLQPGQTPVQPVLYKVLEWGKSRPPAEAGSTEAAQGDNGH